MNICSGIREICRLSERIKAKHCQTYLIGNLGKFYLLTLHMIEKSIHLLEDEEAKTITDACGGNFFARGPDVIDRVRMGFSSRCCESKVHGGPKHDFLQRMDREDAFEPPNIGHFLVTMISEKEIFREYSWVHHRWVFITYLSLLLNLRLIKGSPERLLLSSQDADHTDHWINENVSKMLTNGPYQNTRGESGLAALEVDAISQNRSVPSSKSTSRARKSKGPPIYNDALGIREKRAMFMKQQESNYMLDLTYFIDNELLCPFDRGSDGQISLRVLSKVFLTSSPDTQEIYRFFQSFGLFANMLRWNIMLLIDLCRRHYDINLPPLNFIHPRIFSVPAFNGIIHRIGEPKLLPFIISNDNKNYRGNRDLWCMNAFETGGTYSIIGLSKARDGLTDSKALKVENKYLERMPLADRKTKLKYRSGYSGDDVSDTTSIRSLREKSRTRRRNSFENRVAKDEREEHQALFYPDHLLSSVPSSDFLFNQDKFSHLKHIFEDAETDWLSKRKLSDASKEIYCKNIKAIKDGTSDFNRSVERPRKISERENLWQMNLVEFFNQVSEYESLNFSSDRDGELARYLDAARGTMNNFTCYVEVKHPLSRRSNDSLTFVRCTWSTNNGFLTLHPILPNNSDTSHIIEAGKENKKEQIDTGKRKSRSRKRNDKEETPSHIDYLHHVPENLNHPTKAIFRSKLTHLNVVMENIQSAYIEEQADPIQRRSTRVTGNSNTDTGGLLTDGLSQYLSLSREEAQEMIVTNKAKNEYQEHQSGLDISRFAVPPEALASKYEIEHYVVGSKKSTAGVTYLRNRLRIWFLDEALELQKAPVIKRLSQLEKDRGDVLHMASRDPHTRINHLEPRADGVDPHSLYEEKLREIDLHVKAIKQQNGWLLNKPSWDYFTMYLDDALHPDTAYFVQLILDASFCVAKSDPEQVGFEKREEITVNKTKKVNKEFQEFQIPAKGQGR